MTAIILISIAIGCIPALIVYNLWNRWVFVAFYLQAAMEQYIMIAGALNIAFVQLNTLRHMYFSAKLKAMGFPSGGIVHNNNNDMPESVIPRT